MDGCARVEGKMVSLVPIGAYSFRHSRFLPSGGTHMAIHIAAIARVAQTSLDMVKRSHRGEAV